MESNRTLSGWFSTIAIVLLSFVVLLSFMVGFAVLWHDWLHDGFELCILFLACIAIAVGFVWSSSRIVQFHTCFWSGIGVLAATLLLVIRIMAEIRDGDGRYEVQAAPLFISIATTFGLILLITALCLERPDSRTR